MTIRSLCVAAAIATAAWGSALCAAPAAQAGPANAPCKPSGCVFRNCTDAHSHGRGNIPQDDPAYCASQDRDGDGLACEWK
jgi:hypothetical protein